jgi:large subunit ribosomal protein L29
MKASDLRELTPEELRRRMAGMREELFKLKLRLGTEELPNPLRLRSLRRDIARCETVLSEKVKELGVAAPEKQ